MNCRPLNESASCAAPAVAGGETPASRCPRQRLRGLPPPAPAKVKRHVTSLNDGKGPPPTRTTLPPARGHAGAVAESVGGVYAVNVRSLADG